MINVLKPERLNHKLSFIRKRFLFKPFGFFLVHKIKNAVITIARNRPPNFLLMRINYNLLSMKRYKYNI